MALPHSPDTAEPYVDPPSDTGKFVEALEKLGGGKKLFGVSDMRTCAEFMRVWSETVGVKGRFKEITREKFIAEVAKVNEGLAREVADSRGFNTEFGWNGGEGDVLRPKDVSLSSLNILFSWLWLFPGADEIFLTIFELADSSSSLVSRLQLSRSIFGGRTGRRLLEARRRVCKVGLCSSGI
jgi:hypothetical protein